MRLRSLIYYSCLCLFIVAFHSIKVKAQLTADFSVNSTSGCVPLLLNFKDISTGSPDSWEWDFGNGNNSTLQNPSLIYTQPGTYTIRLKVSNSGGATHTETKTAYIRVLGNPVADFTVDTTKLCPYSPFAFADLSVPNAVSGSAITQWQWDFGDGKGATTTNASHAYDFSGNFTVKLTIKDANGCSNFKEYTNLITVYPKPKAQFTASKTASCVTPFSVQFTNTSQNAVSYNWDLGNGNTTTQANASTTYETAGSFTVKLIATSANGCVDTASTVISSGNKMADFSYSPTQGCIDNPLHFSSSVTGNPINFSWSFGNGETSTDANPDYTFTSPGVYSVSFFVDYADGCSDTITKTITIDDIPDVKINYTPKSSCAVPFNVTFTNPISNATSLWNFGDGQTSSQKNVIHTYTSRGPFIVTLTAETPGGCSAVRTDTIDFNPVLLVNSSQKEFCGATEGTVSFSYTPEYTTPNNPVSWRWEFGDGNISTLRNPSHTYTSEGTFLVKLAITYPNNCVITGWDTISIFPYPIPDFTTDYRDVCVRQTVQFINLCQNCDSAIWDFGDKIITPVKLPMEPGVNVTHKYYVNPKGIAKLTDTLDIKIALFNGPCRVDTVAKKYMRVRAPLAYTEPVLLYCDTPAMFTATDISLYQNPRDSVSRFWVFGDALATKVGGLPCTVDTKNGTNVNVNCNQSVDSVVTHKYTQFGNYNAYLRTESKTTGCIDSFEFTVKVRPKYNLGFTSSVDTGCAPLTVSFSDTTATSSEWKWDFGDLSTDADTAVSRDTAWTFTRPGNYVVILTAKDTAGCIQTFFKTIRVRGPLANFGITGKLCPPDTVKFTDLSITTSSIVKWKWNFGDAASAPDDTSNLQNPVHRFSAIGNYVVSLIVTDTENCVHSMAKLINYGPPKPAFNVDKNIVCQNLDVTFLNRTPGGNSYTWFFDDGTSSTSFNPTHSYADTGTYTVKLIAKRTDGCSDSVSNIQVRVVLPSVNFSADNTEGLCPPFTVHFDDSVTDDIVEWNWDFGDSSYSVIPNPIHTYNKPGQYTVTLRVKSAGGCSDSIAYVDYIKVGGPVGDFTFTPKNGCLPLGTGFKAAATGAALYTWDFADGEVNNAVSDTIYHTYTKAGTFKPVLFLTDTNNCSIAYPASDSIVILPASKADFAASDTAICVGGNVLFTDQSTTPAGVTIVSRFWDFGDNATATTNPVAHIYTTSGDFDVTLAINDSRGCTDTLFKPTYIRSTLQPVVTITPDTAICAGESVQLTATGGVTYRWSPQAGLSDSRIANPVATPASTTTYEVTVKGAGNCDSIKAQITITVYPLPAINAGNDVALCEGDSVQLNASGGIAYTWYPDSGLSDNTIANPFVKLNTNTTYAVAATDHNGCVNSDTINVTVVPPPVANVSGPELVCYGAVITLEANGGETYLWSTGNTENRIIQEIRNDTTFWVLPFVQGCVGEADTIAVRISGDVVEADFSTLSDTVFTVTQVQFINQSKGAETYHWDFAWNPAYDGRSTSNLENPNHTYERRGNYTVLLVVKSNIGCLDSIYKNITVIDNDIFIPTAFTPNGDRLNDRFYFVASSPVDEFVFAVYNRWGQQVFETSDKLHAGWDGYYNGEPAQQDVYIYLFKGKVNNKNVKLSGSVTLLR